jgi:hypothetical protein
MRLQLVKKMKVANKNFENVAEDRRTVGRFRMR